MGVICDRLKLGSTAALNCWTGQKKGKILRKRALIPTRLIALRPNMCYKYVNVFFDHFTFSLKSTFETDVIFIFFSTDSKLSS
jgi:hypothetical protein